MVCSMLTVNPSANNVPDTHMRYSIGKSNHFEILELVDSINRACYSIGQVVSEAS